jgi:outer membrane receptor protein involved in Fe transport
MFKNTARGRSSAYLLAAASATALAVAAAPAFAQDTADVGEVVVTASRIQSAGFTAPTPTTVLGTTEMTRRAPVTIQEVINEVPSFRPSTTTQNTSTTTSGTNGNAGAASVDLRGLGSARTLLLINGRRTGGSQDLNQFPTIMVQRVDVVTGGASAAYGSDAVAGVVNIVLDGKFEGFKGEAQAGSTKYGDGDNWKLSGMFGKSFFNDRVHLTFGGEYNSLDPITTKAPRPWILANRQLQITNPCPINVPQSVLNTPTCNGVSNGYPQYINTDNENFSTLAQGGIITAGPLKGITFEDGGVPRQYQYGVVMGQYMIGGERSDFTTFNINAELRRYALFGHLDFHLTDKTNLWFEYSNAQNHGTTLTSRPRDQGTITIQRGNPFIPAVIAAQMAPGVLSPTGLTSLTMGRLNQDGGQPVSDNFYNIYRFAGGLEGEFGLVGKQWKWDAYYQYGYTHTFVKTVGSRNNNRWRQALDAVVGPNGTPVCRDPTGGCVPFNIFGPNAASQAARDFVFGTQTSDTQRSQTAAAFNISGEPASTWAGPIALAFGAEYRKEYQNTYGDPLAQLSIWDSGNTKQLSGEFDVYEGYAELAVPLAKDMPFAKSLDLNGAARRTHYSTGNGYWVTTWKVGGTWEPTDFLRFRAAVSRDIRAPSIAELYNAGTVAFNNAVNFAGPFKGQATLAALTTVGNANLKPERSTTYTLGGTFSPKFTRLRFSADYFNINIKDQIGTLGVNAIVDRCTKVGDPSFCALISQDAAGTITAVLNQTVNSNSFQTRGLDLEASFTQPLNEVWSALPGTLNVRALATRVFEYALTDAVLGRTDRHGQNMANFIGTTNVPDWMANYFIQYNVGKFTGGVQFRYISPGVLETGSITGTATERLNNKIGSQTITNFSAQYRILDQDGRRLELFGAINNAFNRGPPYPIWGLSNLGIYYDAVGMSFRGGVRFTY